MGCSAFSVSEIEGQKLADVAKFCEYCINFLCNNRNFRCCAAQVYNYKQNLMKRIIAAIAVVMMAVSVMVGQEEQSDTKNTLPISRSARYDIHP